MKEPRCSHALSVHFNCFTLFPQLFPSLYRCTQLCMFVLLAHIAVIVCSFYALPVKKKKKAVQVDELTDGVMGSRELDNREGRQLAQVHIHGLEGRWENGGGREMRRVKICVHISITHSHRLTHNMHSTCALWHLSLIAQMGLDSQADGKKKRRLVGRLLCSRRGCCLCVHWSAAGGGLHIHPDKQSDSTVFVCGVAWPAFMPSPVTRLAR